MTIHAIPNCRIEAAMAPTPAPALSLNELLFNERTQELSRSDFVKAVMDYAAATKVELTSNGPSLYSILVTSPKMISLKHSGLDGVTFSRSMSELTGGYIHFDILYKDDPAVCQQVLTKVFSTAYRVEVRIKNPTTGFIESRVLRLHP